MSILCSHVQYVDGEPVTIWLGRVGPYFNPHEQYHFYSLPVCRPGIILEPETRYAGFSDLFNELENSHLPVSFRRNVVDQPICSMVLSEADTELFGFAISNHYWYQLYVDELPMWAMVGEVASDLDDSHSQEDHTSVTHDIADESFLFTHKEFSIAYNGDRIIEVCFISDFAWAHTGFLFPIFHVGECYKWKPSAGRAI